MVRRNLLSLAVVAAIAACSEPASTQSPPLDRANLRTAVFAGGCFWSVERAFEGMAGVVEAESGFAGGTVANPTYLQVVRGGTGHLEAVRVTYDPARTSYRRLVDAFWRTIDPTDPGGQFCDRGDSYRTAVFVANADQRRAAEASRTEAQAALGGSRRIVTEIRDAARFWRAEDEHQDFARRNPVRYNGYVVGCRRNERLRQVWGDS